MGEVGRCHPQWDTVQSHISCCLLDTSRCVFRGEYWILIVEFDFHEYIPVATLNKQQMAKGKMGSHLCVSRIGIGVWK